jgi:tetratricopeptide (TPR) repeat protein
MRIDRGLRARRLYRRRRWSGCASLLPAFGLAFVSALLTWAWLNRGDAPPELAAGNHQLLQAAGQAFARGDLDNAVLLTRQYLSQSPDSMTAHDFGQAVQLATRALVYASYSEYDRAPDRATALAFAERARLEAPTNLEVAAAYAFALASSMRPADAADTARWVLERDPAHPLARTALALAHNSAGSHDTALSEAVQAVRDAEARGYRMDALRALAVAYGALARYQEAAYTVEQAMQYGGQVLALYFERALYALQVGDADSATVAYFQVISLAPDNVKARLRLCELSTTMRESEAALQYCGEVTTLAPEWADGWYRLGREYFLRGAFEEAQQALHQCAVLQTLQDVPVSQRRFECWYLQGQAAQINGDCEALVATYNEFRAMATDEAIKQTWTFPPEGPACAADAP